jgi:hypothetical protein
MKKYKLSKEEQVLYEKLLELSKTTNTRPKLVSSNYTYQFISSSIIKEKMEAINKNEKTS